MKAVVYRNGEFKQKEIPSLKPNNDQLLVKPLAVGICGSDLSAVQHTEDFLESVKKAGDVGQAFNPDKDLVLGHEFTAKVLEVGENVSEYKPGDYLVILPWVIGEDGVTYTVGYSNDFPGGFSEHVLVGNGGHYKIPDGVNPYYAAVTEPLATGYNSVLRSDISDKDGAIVTGAGTVGLGAVIALSSKGVYPIIVSEPSQKRREIALSYGAHKAVNPLEENPIEIYLEQIKNINKRLYLFETSGVKNIINNLVETVPKFTKFYIVGASMENNIIRPTTLVNKNISLHFISGPGYGEMTYKALGETFYDLVNGKFNPKEMVTSFTGFKGVSKAFKALRPSGDETIEQVKILILPDLDSDKLIPPEEVKLLNKP